MDRKALDSQSLLNIYRSLRARFGHRCWWPGETPFEVVVGAILTQNTAWVNVEKAIANLKRAEMLTVEALLDESLERLSELIRPSGYYNQKALRLRAISRWFWDRCRGDPLNFEPFATDVLRSELLALNGIGPETADSVLLYALNRPVFVIDAYTRRIMNRLGFVDEAVKYNDLQACFHLLLPQDLGLYNDFHAQFVALGKDFCRPKPACSDCPLTNACQYY